MKIKPQEMIIFFKQLATLVRANIPLLQSCHLLFQSQKNPSLRAILLSLKKEIEAGRGLAHGIKKFPSQFNSVVCHLIQVGEITGTLETILKLTATLLEDSLRIRNQIKQALFYPTIVFFISIVVCLMMLIFIVPRFEEFFQNFHGTLPLYTRIIIELSKMIRTQYGFFILPVIVCAAVFYYYQQSHSFKKTIHRGIYQLPFFSKLFVKIFILNFVRNLSIIYSSGINIVEGLQIIKQAQFNSSHSDLIRQIKIKVSSGQQLHMAMRFCLIFPPIVIQMIRIGEETGALHSMLETIIDLYENDISRIVTRMNQLLEPLIMIILGALIGGLIIAMYLPIFKLGTII